MYPATHFEPRPFSLTGTVSNARYAATGLVLMPFKYAIEAVVIYLSTGLIYTPLDFAAPMLTARERFFDATGAWLGFAWLIWTIPFVWVAVAMTLRRARDVGWTAWLCLFILVPLLNLVTMIVLAVAPPKEVTEESHEEDGNQRDEVFLRDAWSAPQSEEAQPRLISETSVRESSPLVAALIGLAIGVSYTVVLVVLCVFAFGEYGSALFFGAPIVTGAAAAYLFNRPIRRTLGSTIGHGILLTLCCCSAFLLVGLEGMICVFMAIPILGPLTLFGSAIGWAIAGSVATTARQDDNGLVGCLIVLPLLASVEPYVAKPIDLMVETSVDIAAAPEEVWDTVVAFPEIETPPEWYFRWGIASPIRARIDGHGVGAVRHCEFTTGAFVEPITVWDKPNRLAFDVTDQPEPMYELTPYRHLHPPHLKNSFVSNRGEFELVALEGGGTRLIGRTWYSLDIAPHGYWRYWTDEIVHRIHLRVLRHILTVAEAGEVNDNAPPQ